MVDAVKARSNMVPTTPPGSAIRSGLVAESGLIVLESIDTQTEVAPGDQIAVSVTVKNNAQFIEAFTEPDSCVAGNLFEGFRIDLELLVDGDRADVVQRCVPIRGERTAELSVRAPTIEGAVPIEVRAVAANSGNFQDAITASTEVTTEPVDQACPDGFQRDPDTGDCVPIEDSGGDDNGPFPGDGGSDDPIQQASNLVFMVVLLVVVASVARVLA